MRLLCCHWLLSRHTFTSRGKLESNLTGYICSTLLNASSICMNRPWWWLDSNLQLLLLSAICLANTRLESSWQRPPEVSLLLSLQFMCKCALVDQSASKVVKHDKEVPKNIYTEALVSGPFKSQSWRIQMNYSCQDPAERFISRLDNCRYVHAEGNLSL